jgi:hypothetical protein
MPATIAFTDINDLSGRVSRAAAKKLVAMLPKVGEDAVRRCNEYVAAELDTGRPLDRRKGKKGQARPLLNSFSYEIEWNGIDFPVKLLLKSRADQRKVGALEFGSKAHRIPGNPWLAIPNPARPQVASPFQHPRHRGRDTGYPVSIVREVWWTPGSKSSKPGLQFMHRALEDAQRAAFG